MTFIKRIARLKGKKVSVSCVDGQGIVGTLSEIGDDYLCVSQTVQEAQIRGWRPTPTIYRYEHIIRVNRVTKSKLKGHA